MNDKTPFRTSPSHIARFFFFDCERYFRYSAATSGKRKKDGIPDPAFDASPAMQAIMDHGISWEEQVVKKLGASVHIAPGTGPLSERRFDLDQTVAILKGAAAGTYLYQTTLRTPETFLKQYNISPDLIHFSDNHPDLIKISAASNGKRLLQVIDVKRGASLKNTHRMQVLLYALQLQAMVRELGIADIEVDCETGLIWLGNEPSPTACDLRSIRPYLEGFLRDDMPRILSSKPNEAMWHLYFRCEWCGYFTACKEEMLQQDSVSKLANLTVRGKRFLHREAKVETVKDLEGFLKRKDCDETLAKCASLAGRRMQLATQVESLRQSKVIATGSSTPILPKGENIGIFLTLQQEPTCNAVYLAGLLVTGKRETLDKLKGLKLEGTPEVWVARSNDKKELYRLRREFLSRLALILRHVDQFNAGHAEWSDQLTLQVYVHAEHDHRILLDVLLESLNDPSLAEDAMTLLFYFQAPDAMASEKHPGDPVHSPLVVLLSVLGRLVALPVPVSYTLPESLQALSASFGYKRNEYLHYPLGHALRPDPIYNAWQKGQATDIDRLERAGRNHLYATRSLLLQLRTILSEHLFAWPAKMRLPTRHQISDPLLSRLAFFTRYESLLGCMAIRNQRAEALAVQQLAGTVIELEALTASEFRVLNRHGVELDDSSFPAWLIVRDSKEGRLAQMSFFDYWYRAQPYAAKNPHRAITSVSSVISDSLGFAQKLVLSSPPLLNDEQPRKGERFLLYPRFMDYNSEKVVAFLKTLDLQKGLFTQLLNQPSHAAQTQPLPKKADRICSDEVTHLALTESQVTAYEQIRKQKALAVWGPPGTGKTHFLASVILGLVSAHAQIGKPFRVLVTAFTHAAIENLLRKVANRMEVASIRKHLEIQDLSLGKIPSWHSAPITGVQTAKNLAWCEDHPYCVAGATVYGALKTSSMKFDLVIVDEASQVRVPEASIPISMVSESGRLLLAGDHKQLPPIVTGQYPEPPEGQPLLHRSIFEVLIPRGQRDHATVAQLLENWRMNDVLTSYASSFIYGPDYRPASPAIAARRLMLTPAKKSDSLIETVLSPAHPLVLIVLEGAAPARENQIEADIVAQLTVELRKRLLDRHRKPYATDRDFFKEGLFVISPHHAQIGLIRRALHGQRKWDFPPFVDTCEKMQGQEADAVIVSYGVSDAEFALQEAEFIYGLNRLNVAVTRARAKSIVCLPRPLIDGCPQILDTPMAEQGLAFMRQMVAALEQHGERHRFEVTKGIHAVVLRTSHTLRPN